MEKALDGIPLGLGSVMKINLQNFHEGPICAYYMVYADPMYQCFVVLREADLGGHQERANSIEVSRAYCRVLSRGEGGGGRGGGGWGEGTLVGPSLSKLQTCRLTASVAKTLIETAT